MLDYTLEIQLKNCRERKILNCIFLVSKHQIKLTGNGGLFRYIDYSANYRANNVGFVVSKDLKNSFDPKMV